MYVNVQGGTGAGRKRPLRPKPSDWMHLCRGQNGGRLLPGYLSRCLHCGAARPT